jgi:hypothetical protein
MGNKIDLTSIASISKEDLGDVAKKYKSSFFLTSAKTGENVELAFSKIAKSMVKPQAENNDD